MQRSRAIPHSSRSWPRNCSFTGEGKKMENLRKYSTLIGAVMATVAAVGILANLHDIVRYVRISRM